MRPSPAASLVADASLGVLLWSSGVRADTFWVATDGVDATGDGSAARPWATLRHAIDAIPPAGGHSIVVRDGVYRGQTTVTHGFATPVVVRAEHPYRVTFTNADAGGEALRVYVMGDARISFEGFVFTNAHPTYTCPMGREAFYLVHVQDASEVAFRDDVFFGNSSGGTGICTRPVPSGCILYRFCRTAPPASWQRARACSRGAVGVHAVHAELRQWTAVAVTRVARAGVHLTRIARAGVHLTGVCAARVVGRCKVAPARRSKSPVQEGRFGPPAASRKPRRLRLAPTTAARGARP